MAWEEVLVFQDIPEEAKKVYFEVIFLNLQSGIQYCGGVGFIDVERLEILEQTEKKFGEKEFLRLDREEQENQKRRYEEYRVDLMQVHLMLKGKEAGVLNIDFDLLSKQVRKRKKPLDDSFVDIRTLSKPNEFDQKRLMHLKRR